MSNTTAIISSTSHSSPDVFSKVSWNQLTRNYIWYMDTENNALKLKEIVNDINHFVWNELQVVRLKGNRPPPFIYSFEKQKVACYHHIFFLQRCYKTLHPATLAHAYTHGILENYSSSEEHTEWLTIIESLADIVGVIFNQFYSKNFKNWSIGDRDLYTYYFKDGTCKHLLFKRESHEIPSKDGDLGHIHFNSEILSLAFYFASRNLGFDPDCKKTLLKIWFNSVMTLKKEEKTYSGLRAKTIELASKELDSKVEWSIIEQAVTQAWEQIGFVTNPTCPYLPES